ncbi:hypothetical protein HOD08_03880 [bacterium]|nr:hypothetical protein [bacterium]
MRHQLHLLFIVLLAAGNIVGGAEISTAKGEAPAAGKTGTKVARVIPSLTQVPKDDETAQYVKDLLHGLEQIEVVGDTARTIVEAMMGLDQLASEHWSTGEIADFIKRFNGEWIEGEDDYFCTVLAVVCINKINRAPQDAYRWLFPFKDSKGVESPGIDARVRNAIVRGIERGVYIEPVDIPLTCDREMIVSLLKSAVRMKIDTQIRISSMFSVDLLKEFQKINLRKLKEILISLDKETHDAVLGLISRKGGKVINEKSLRNLVSDCWLHEYRLSDRTIYSFYPPDLELVSHNDLVEKENPLQRLDDLLGGRDRFQKHDRSKFADKVWKVFFAKEG